MLRVKLLLILILLELAQAKFLQTNDSQKLSEVLSQLIDSAVAFDCPTIQIVKAVQSRNAFKAIDLENDVIRKSSSITLLLEPKAIVDGQQLSCSHVVVDSFAGFMDAISKLEKLNQMPVRFLLIAIIDGMFPQLSKLFDYLWSFQIYNVYVVFEDVYAEVSTFTIMPFRSGLCNDMQPFKVTNITKEALKEFRNGMFDDLQECPIRVAIGNETNPYVYAEQMANGSKVIKGLDIHLLTALAESLNFIINFTYIGLEGRMHDNGTAEGVFKELKDDRADMIIGDYWLKASRIKHFGYSASYAYSEIVLLIPHVTEMTSLEKLSHPFSASSWIMIGTSFAVGVLVVAFVRWLAPKWLQDVIIGSTIRTPLLNMLIVIFGSSQHKLPRSTFARFLLMSFLIECLILRTVYQGSLYHLFHTSRLNKLPETINEMIQMDFKFYSNMALWEYFQTPQKLQGR